VLKCGKNFVHPHHRSIITWLFTGCFLIYLMVLVGGITRLTGSGLSITEWKVVTGTLPPLSEEAWQQEFEAYKKIPQYKLINSSFTLADFKGIYWWEYIHRLLGRVIGAVFIIPFIWFLIKKKFPPGFAGKMWLLLALGGLQGFLGWFMVSSGLSENVYVSHYRLAVHLIAAFTVFGFTFWYALDLTSPSRFPPVRGLRGAAFLLFLFVLLWPGSKRVTATLPGPKWEPTGSRKK
jgi:cytochrome c oxidase assembly protein subunit 15